MLRFRNMQLTILFLTAQTEQSGNFGTINRIRLFLSRHGHWCCTQDPNSFESVVAFQAYIARHLFDVVIGIHAHRSGYLLRGSTVPYILILGGTDVNEFYKDIKKLTVMTEAVCNARYVVAFGKSLSTRLSLLWPRLPNDKVKEIKQAVITQPSRFSLLEYLKRHQHVPTSVTTLRDVTVFLFLGGIRPVKDPIYLIETFSEWHHDDRSVYYVIVGPKIDQNYFDQYFSPALKKSNGVIYIPGLPIQDSQAAMRDCFSVVNSSISEGMSLAVLEAMKLGVPVFARNVPGNRDVIQDGKTGLTYDNPEEFAQKARSLLSSPEKKDKIVAMATEHVIKNHSIEDEGQVYLSLVKSACALP